MRGDLRCASNRAVSGSYFRTAASPGAERHYRREKPVHMIIVRLTLSSGHSPDTLEATAIATAFRQAALADDALEHLRVQTSDREIAVAVFVGVPGPVQATLRAWQICLRVLDS